MKTKETYLNINDKFSREFTRQYILDTKSKIQNLIECHTSFWDKIQVDIQVFGIELSSKSEYSHKTNVIIQTHWFCNFLRSIRILPKIEISAIESELNKRKPIGTKITLNVN